MLCKCRTLAPWLDPTRRLLETPILTIGKRPITRWSVMYAPVLIFGLFWVVTRVPVLLSDKRLARTALVATAVVDAR